MAANSLFPRRIVCLSSETTEIVYQLGAASRLVGVPGYATRPPEAASKPKIGGFSSVDVDAVLEQQPDLVLSFSDLQKDAVRDLLGAGINVLALNQRSLEETLQSILLIGRSIGCEEKANALVENMQSCFQEIRQASAAKTKRPRVYFEEWDDPMISGIGWIGEMIEMAGGIDVLAENRKRKAASERIVDGDLLIDRDPEIILAAWCGKRVDIESICSRPGWERINAVRNRRIFALEDELFLSPGPALCEGAKTLQDLFAKF